MKGFNRKYTKVFGVIAAMLSLGLVSCSSDDGSETNGDTTINDTARVTGVTLSQPTLSLGVDETSTLTATVTGTNLSDSDKTVTWTSSREDVATVSDGKVTAIAAGTSRITATSTVNTSVSAYCDVTVSSNASKESTKNEVTVGTKAAAYNYSYTGSGATIYIYSQSSGLNFYGIKVGSSTWLPSDIGAATYSQTTDLTSNGVTFTAVIGTSGDTMTIDTSSATIDGTKYTARFKTGGAALRFQETLRFLFQRQLTLYSTQCLQTAALSAQW